MENKTLNVIVVYSKQDENTVGVFTNTDEAVASIAKHIVENISLFEDFIDDYKTYLCDCIDELYKYEDDAPYTVPKSFADWLKETVTNYDSCDWRNNIAPYFAFDDVTLTLE